MHIAASLNVPVVAIFGPTTKILGFTPYNTRNIIVEINDLYCRPCKLHGGNYCPEKHFICMNSISVNDVLESLLKILNIL
jgi:heptosyltransferase-2